MSQIVVFYNPFLPELKITINGNRVAAYSTLMDYQHQRIEKWSDCLFSKLYREVNSDYDILCISNGFVCGWLKEIAQQNPHCKSFASQPLPYDASVHERFERLRSLGCEEASRLVVPIVNASGDVNMTKAVFEVIEEQGVFNVVSGNRIVWTDCPLTTVEMKSYELNDYQEHGNVSFIVAICSSEEDYINITAEVPVYALVMGAETHYIRKQNGIHYFSVASDDISRILLEMLEEEALSPLLSELCYRFQENGHIEKKELEKVCQAAPFCRVTLPKIFDVGRNVEIKPQLFPANCGLTLRISSDKTDVIDSEGNTLIPRAIGTAKITVYAGEDPYPILSQEISVQNRKLLTTITLFPSALCMPVRGESTLKITIDPEDAENIDEIRWSSDNTSIASVDPVTGVITAHSCGGCEITACTQEVSNSVQLEVQPEIKEVSWPGGFVNVRVGEHKEWRYSVDPKNGYGADALSVIYSDRNVAEYRGGYIIGKKVGECKIYVKNQSGTIRCELRVTVTRR